MTTASSLYLGLDIGGTKVAAGLVAADGEVLASTRRTTADLRHQGDFVAGLIRLSRSLMNDASHLPPTLTGIGLALPGPVDPRLGAIRRAPRNQELEGVALGDIFAREFHCPAVAGNDANCAALGEALFGAGRGHDSVAYFTISTGIGGGFVRHGQPWSGARGTAAEFGHIILDPDGPPCDCGGRGCLEALASGTAIARRAQAALTASPRSLLADPEFLAGRELDARVVADAAQRGDATALTVWEESMSWLGLGLGTVINVLDPAIVVLGGGVAAAGNLLLEPVRQTVRERCMPDIARETPIVLAALKSDVGIVGAAALAMAGE